MSDGLVITLSSDAEALLRNAKDVPDFLVKNVQRALDLENQLAIAHISEARLSGQGPFPVSEHRLGVRTNRLRGSLRATKAQATADGVVSSIGTNVRYAGIHEFGGEIKRTVKAGSVRLRTDARGNLLKRGNLATFAGPNHKRFKEVGFAGGRGYVIRIPERAPIRTGIQDRAANYSAAISQAVVDAFKAGGSA